MNIDVKNEPQRSTCIVCGRKKERKIMVKHGQHWSCKLCLSGGDTSAIEGIVTQDPRNVIKVLNLYAGIGGNRKLWPANVQVTAVELNPKVAAAYQSLYAQDIVICGNAHDYLLKNYFKFDFIWTSRPCVSHSRMNYWLSSGKKRYPDLSLYEEIIFLQNFCKVPWVSENVDPYYVPLVEPSIKLGRHLFWSNFHINPVHQPALPGFIHLDSVSDKNKIMDWLGIHLEKNLYLSGKNYLQVFRNCVHPKIGLSIFNDAFQIA